MTADKMLRIEPLKTALIIQDMQNDVLSEGGAWADSGAPLHAKSQNIVANVALLAAEARRQGAPVIHVHYIVEPGAVGLKLIPGRHCMPSPRILWRTWRFLRPKLAAREHPSSMSTTSWNLEQ